MTKKWMIIQNVVATALLAWALFFLYSFTDSVFTNLSNAVHSGIVKQSDINYAKMLGIYNAYYLCGILAGYAGMALLFEKKWGWVASVASSLIFMGFMLVSARNGLTADDNGKSSGTAVSYLITGILFGVIFILLMLKPLRAKYQPTLLNWLAIAGIIVFVIVDKQALGH